MLLTFRVSCILFFVLNMHGDIFYQGYSYAYFFTLRFPVNVELHFVVKSLSSLCSLFKIIIMWQFRKKWMKDDLFIYLFFITVSFKTHCSGFIAIFSSSLSNSGCLSSFTCTYSIQHKFLPIKISLFRCVEIVLRQIMVKVYNFKS